jgi:hypothetical protein
MFNILDALALAGNHDIGNPYSFNESETMIILRSILKNPA